MHSTLALVLILLATAVLVVVIFRQLRLPALIGYLLVGILIGPHALGWAARSEETRYLAEFGVVFLMFSVGLEFSLPKLVTMRRAVFGLGAAQVVATTLPVLLLCAMLSVGWRAGLVLGGALAMSSTAILARMLTERLELNSQHGRAIIGVLLFQDLAVIPFLILVPALAQSAGDLAKLLSFALVKAAVVLSVVLFLGQRLMRPWFHLVARQKSPELFMLNLLLFTLGLAWITERFGLSMALGAFLAGMLISETEYRYQVEQDIRPFQDVLMGLFFVTVGMQLDPSEVASHPLWVLAVLVALLLFKSALITGLSRLFGSDPGAALRTGLALCAGGEFGLVLLSQATGLHVLAPQAGQVVLAAMILSMLLAPFIIENSEHMVRRFSGADWMYRAMALHNIAAQTLAAEKHVIICGYGRSGQYLTRLMEQEAIAVIALDVDPQRVREAAAAGESVVFGDAARREVLIAAGLMRASCLVVSYADTNSALRILHVVNELRPGMPVVVRTVDDSDIDRLKQAGAAEVVPEILEGSLMLASHALMLVGVPFNRVLRRIRETRQHRYELFRGFFHGVTDETGEDRDRLHPRLHSVMITPGAAAVRKTLRELDLPSLGVVVTAIRRRSIRSPDPAPETQLLEGDVVVLRGVEENLALAETKLMQG
ncbi:MAG TPA: monovalent cation:proton antiporter-2 (CPA2) family protein [Burkholderiales bacterium]|nr:monovalent cation:proton antiporter-2 (CPA2) family protein [Burkholderiales bacterium]